MSDLQPGDPAPDFTLESDGGNVLRLSDYGGRNVVVYFYPKDDTSGCTKEAEAFSALLPEFRKAATEVIGVSKDSVASHAKFRAKYHLDVSLGADPDGIVVETFGAWVEKSMYGKKYMGIDRSTFLIDGHGKIAALWRKVKVPGHAQAVLEAARKLG